MSTATRKMLPFARLALDADVAAQLAGDVAADGQSQAGAAVLARDRVVGLVEGLEDPLQVFGGDADAGVFDFAQ